MPLASNSEFSMASLAPPSPRLFNLMRIFHPSSGRDAVQAANDRNTHRLFDSLHLFQIWLRTYVIVIQVGKVAQRLGKGLGTPVEIVIELVALMGDLFLKQGIHHDSGSTCVF